MAAGRSRIAQAARQGGYILAAALLVLAQAMVLGLPLGSAALAGELKKADLAKHFPAPYVVGERDAALPVWPLFRRTSAQTDELAGYAFESIDLAPLPGYAGTPPNLLIAIAPDGIFLGVSIISHHEPIFFKGVAESQLFRFVEQYRGLTLKQNIKTGAPGSARDRQSASVMIDGVSKATVSVRVINETVLASSLKIARAKLGFAGSADAGLAKQLKPDDGVTLSADELAARSYLLKAEIRTADIDQAFGPGLSKDVEGAPRGDAKAASTEIWAAYLSAPQIGRAVLGKDAYEKLMETVPAGDHAILIATRGRYGSSGQTASSGAAPEQVALVQDGLPVNVSDTVFLRRTDKTMLPPDATWSVLKVIGQSGFDPSRPWQLALRVARQDAGIFPKRAVKEFPATYPALAEYFTTPEPPLFGWRAMWHEQWRQIALTLTALAVLTVALLMPRRLSAHPQAFRIFRLSFLAATLIGIGWWGQGQLSILNVIGLIGTAKETGDYGYLLFDPVSLFLWIFVLVGLAIWGRGIFCGWLCPFGALQEFAYELGKKIGAPQMQIPYAIDRKLRLIKYAVLAAILASAIVSGPLADALAEFEPFKTAITLGFNRYWPFLAYAVAMVYVSTFLFKGFCLYLCPLGAFMALLGRARRFDWIARRAECGSPCQLCAKRCRYGAIEPQGQVRYDECFQCMDCVVIYHDPKTCVPRVLEAKGRARPTPPVQPRPAVKKPRIPETVS